MVACVTAARQPLPTGTSNQSPKAIRKLNFPPFKKKGGGRRGWELQDSNDECLDSYKGQDLAVEEKMNGLVLCCPFITSIWAGFTEER